MGAENLSKFDLSVDGNYVGVADIDLPVITKSLGDVLVSTVVMEITIDGDCFVIDPRKFNKFIGRGYYAKTKGKQPRTVFVRKGGE